MNEPMEKFVKWMEGQEHIPGSAWDRAIKKARSLMAEESAKQADKSIDEDAQVFLANMKEGEGGPR